MTGRVRRVRHPLIAVSGAVILLAGCGSTTGKVDAKPTLSRSADSDSCSTQAPPSATRFCITPAEAALGEIAVHSASLTDAELIRNNVSLTIAPQDHSVITASEAVGAAQGFGRRGQGGSQVTRSSVFAEIHDKHGQPAKGRLVWIVDLTPPGGYQLQPQAESSDETSTPTGPVHFIVVDATTGQALYAASG